MYKNISKITRVGEYIIIAYLHFVSLNIRNTSNGIETLKPHQNFEPFEFDFPV